MKTIKKDELFQNLKDFLKTKGIELQDGSYTQRMQKACGLLADSVNLSQQTLHRAKEEMDKRLDQVRQVIHEKTAPKPPPAAPQAQGTTEQASTEQPKPDTSATKSKRTKARKPRPASRRKHG